MNHFEMAKYAYRKVPFYQNVLDVISEKWSDIPLISKEEMLENLDQNLAPEYLAGYLRGDLDFVMTSGSTGDCLNIYWNKAQNRKSLLSLWIMRKRYYGILPNDKRCYFFTTKIKEGEEVEREQTACSIGFSKMNLTEQRLRQIYQEMQKYEPKWLLMQPSMLILLIQVAEQFDLGKINSLEYIELTGERIHQGQKEQIKHFFQCSIASQYGCYEINSIAYECPEGHMHVMKEKL